MKKFKKIIVVPLLMAALIAAVSQLSSASAEENPQVAFSNAAYCEGYVTVMVTATGLYPSTGHSIRNETDAWASYRPGGTSPDSDENGNFTGTIRLEPEVAGAPAPVSLALIMYVDDSSANVYWESAPITVSVADCSPAPTTTAPTTTVPPTVSTTAPTTTVSPPAPTTAPPVTIVIPPPTTTAPPVTIVIPQAAAKKKVLLKTS